MCGKNIAWYYASYVLAAGWKHFLILCRTLWFPLLTSSLISYLSFCSFHKFPSCFSFYSTNKQCFNFYFSVPFCVHSSKSMINNLSSLLLLNFCKTLLIIYCVLCSHGDFQSHRLVLCIMFLPLCFSSLSVYTNLYYCSLVHSLMFMVWNLLFAGDFSSICWASLLVTSLGVDDGWNNVLLKSTI